MASNVSLRRCVCRLELRRRSQETDESKSDVINTVGSATDSVHRQSSRQPGCAWKRVFSILTRGLCVFLKHVTSQASKLSWIYPWFGNHDSELEVDKCLMKHVPERAVKKVKQPGIGTQEPVKKPARDRDPRTRER